MTFPYWLEQSLIALPLALWIYLGLGLPYALLILPRADWAKKLQVLALGFAFGAALLTAWMFVLGTIGGAYQSPLLRFDLVFGGTVILAIVGMLLAWRKMKNTKASSIEHEPLAFDEKLLLLLMGLGFVLLWLSTSYWVFTGYDTLWVYGYEGRLYALLGYIPQHIGYYPQFLPLQYTFMQLPFGGFDDHAARVVVPFLFMGSILAAYGLGENLFSRRVGIFLAAIWALSPHASQWAFIGDLEIPLAFLFTLSATYFLQAWHHENTALRRRYALIAGLCFGIAMWTKPTAGAFVLGVIFLVLADFLHKLRGAGFDPTKALPLWYPRFEIALITGLACIPLGGIWYLRNVLLGLPALVFPHPNWLSLATRSGDLLSFPLLALFLFLAYLALTSGFKRGGWMLVLGTILVLFGTMPSSPLIDASRRNSPESYIQFGEALSLVLGLGLIGWHLRQYSKPIPRELSKILWAFLLALPYFMTWFWSYSYHARLSFAIVPLLILPTALILSKMQVTQWKFFPRVSWGIAIILLAWQGMTIPIWGVAPTWDWLWVAHYPDDESRYKVHNGDVFLIALNLIEYQKATGNSPVLIAPGEQRLPFFVPDMEIITTTLPTEYAELEGATHYLYGTLARWRYENDEGIAPLSNRVVASLGRSDLMPTVFNFRDGNFVYELYELQLGRRYELPSPDLVEANVSDEIIFGDAIRLRGISIGNTQLAGERIFINFLWDLIAIPQRDYHLRLSLELIETGEIVTNWESPIAPHEATYYNTALWELGEYILDKRSFILDRPRQYPRGQEIYYLRVDFVDIETGTTLPVRINGETVAAYYLPSLFSNGREN